MSDGEFARTNYSLVSLHLQKVQADGQILGIEVIRSHICELETELHPAL